MTWEPAGRVGEHEVGVIDEKYSSRSLSRGSVTCSLLAHSASPTSPKRCLSSAFSMAQRAVWRAVPTAAALLLTSLQWPSGNRNPLATSQRGDSRALMVSVGSAAGEGPGDSSAASAFFRPVRGFACVLRFARVRILPAVGVRSTVFDEFQTAATHAPICGGGSTIGSLRVFVQNARIKTGLTEGGIRHSRGTGTLWRIFRSTPRHPPSHGLPWSISQDQNVSLTRYVASVS